jgi:chromosome segregation ATPase
MTDEQTQAQADDPSGEGWRWVEAREVLRDDDMQQGSGGIWRVTRYAGQPAIDNKTYRRRIEPEQPSDSEPETIDDLRRRLKECEALLAEAERGGEQVNAELQERREQVRELSRQTQSDGFDLRQLRERAQNAEHELAEETKRYRDSFRDHHKAGQQQLVDRLQTWLRPVLEIVAKNPEDSGPLARAVLGYLPQIASRLIEE